MQGPDYIVDDWFTMTFVFTDECMKKKIINRLVLKILNSIKKINSLPIQDRVKKYHAS